MQLHIADLWNLDSAEISDALDSLHIEGALLDIKPIQAGLKLIGPAFTVQYQDIKEFSPYFQNAGNYIDDVPSGAVIVIDNAGRTDCTTWGDILTHFSLQKGIAGTVIHGAARDIKLIKKVNYPLFTKGAYMRSGKNRVRKVKQNCQLQIEGVTINSGDYVFGDDNGVVIIPQEYLFEVIARAKNIRNTEEKIIAAIQNGATLEKARENFHYDQPWLPHN